MNEAEVKRLVEKTVAHYGKAVAGVRKGYEILAGAEYDYEDALKENERETHCFRSTRHIFVLPGAMGVSAGLADSIIQNVSRQTWTHLFGVLGIFSILPARERREVERAIDEGRFPEITISNVIAMHMYYTGNKKELMEQVVRAAWRYASHPTYLGKTVVLKSVLRTYSLNGSVRLSLVYGTTTDGFDDLDRAFHLLDEKDFRNGSEGGLVDAVQKACRSNRPRGETEYFRFKIYKNGNMHIEFKRLDLVTEFNGYISEEAEA